MLIDIGVNLTASSFSHDRDAVIQRARDAGVGTLIVTGTDASHSMSAQALSQVHKGDLYATAGLHPHHATEWNADMLTQIQHVAQQPGIVAVGECGLDFNRDYSPRKDQEYAFEAQLELAVDLQLPVFLHQRDAHDRFMQILGRYRDGLVDAVAHCFTGTKEELLAYLEMDLHIGITAWICDERRGLHLRELVADIPESRLMLETDSPYLLPRDLKPKPQSRRNEPMYLPHICDTVAHYRGVSSQELECDTTANARRFFRLHE